MVSRLRVPSLVLAVVVLFGIATGCGGGGASSQSAPSSAPPTVASTVLIFDISGSARSIGLENSFSGHLAQELNALSDGSRLTVLTLDGGGLTASCPPVKVHMFLTELSDDTRAEERARIRAEAEQAANGLLRCATARAVSGSDLVGAIKAGERELGSPPARRKLVLVSDGMQATSELVFTPRNVISSAWRKQVLTTLRQQSLLPNLTDVQFVITDLTAGASWMTASQAQGVRTFWESYATAAGTRLAEQ